MMMRKSHRVHSVRPWCCPPLASAIGDDGRENSATIDGDPFCAVCEFLNSIDLLASSCLDAVRDIELL